MRRHTPTTIEEFTAIERLSDREMEIFLDLGGGLRHRDIKEKYGIADGTLDTHIINIRTKLDKPHQIALVAYAGAFIALREALGWVIGVREPAPRFELRRAA